MIQIFGKVVWGRLCGLLGRFVCKQPGKVMNGLVCEFLCGVMGEGMGVCVSCCVGSWVDS